MKNIKCYEDKSGIEKIVIAKKIDKMDKFNFNSMSGQLYLLLLDYLFHILNLK